MEIFNTNSSITKCRSSRPEVLCKKGETSKKHLYTVN